MREGDLEQVKARIRALLARTPERGCTEAEAIAAAERALAMMREYGLDETSVQIGKVTLPLRSKKPSEIDGLWVSVASTCRCVAYYIVGGETRRIVYLGREPWPEVAAYLHAVADGAAARASREFARSPTMKRRRTTRTKTVARRAFLLGFASALAEKIRLLVDGFDPAHIRDLEDARAALKHEGPMTSAPRRSWTPDRSFEDALRAGFSEGRRTHVGLGVRGRAGPLALTAEGTKAEGATDA